MIQHSTTLAVWQHLALAHLQNVKILTLFHLARHAIQKPNCVQLYLDA